LSKEKIQEFGLFSESPSQADLQTKMQHAEVNMCTAKSD